MKRLTAAAAAKPAVVVDDDAPIRSPDDPRLDPAAAKSWRASIARQIERERAEARARAIAAAEDAAVLAEDDALAALPVAAAKKHKRPRMPRVATMIELMHAINKTVTAVTETPESVTLFFGAADDAAASEPNIFDIEAERLRKKRGAA